VSIGLRFLNPGYVIGEKYSIVRAIGAGGMGIVYEARHLRLGHPIAVKMLLPDLAEDEIAVARFDREARAVAKLRSIHVAQVFDVGALPDGTPFIVMELLRGRDLADELAERGRLPIDVAVDYVRQACDAMAEAHRVGIVHRDLKPSNLFLVDDGHRRIVKVLDFGISKMTDAGAPSVTTTSSGLGTAVYMSPEQVRAAKHVDARSDVWALGVVLYEMLTGCQPFSGDTSSAVLAAIVADPPEPLRRVRAEVPAELERVVMKALEKDRDRRFRNAAAFADAIAPFATGSRGDAAPRTARDVAPTLKSVPFEGVVARESRAASIPAPSTTTPSLAPPSRVPAARRTFGIFGFLALGMVSSLVLLYEAFPASTGSNSSSAPQVLAVPATRPTNATVLPGSSAEPPRETAKAAPTTVEPPAPAPAPSAQPTSPRTRRDDRPAARTLAAGSGASTANGPQASPSASARAPKPLPRKNAVGLPDDPG
jgi:serine/threonine-protein kinase